MISNTPLARLLRARNLTYFDVADLSGLDHETVRRYAQGVQAMPKSKTLLKLAHALELEPTEVFRLLRPTADGQVVAEEQKSDKFKKALASSEALQKISRQRRERDKKRGGKDFC